jgi:hypothetical protein
MFPSGDRLEAPGEPLQVGRMQELGEGQEPGLRAAVIRRHLKSAPPRGRA